MEHNEPDHFQLPSARPESQVAALRGQVRDLADRLEIVEARLAELEEQQRQQQEN